MLCNDPNNSKMLMLFYGENILTVPNLRDRRRLVFWQVFFSYNARGEHEKAEGGGGGLGHLPFTWKNRKFPLENQVAQTIPFGKLHKI